MLENLCEHIEELMNSPYHQEWKTYSDEISWAPLDVHEKTSLHLVRIAPLSEIPEHCHERPEEKGIEILYIWSGGNFKWENNKDDLKTRLIYLEEWYGIKNLANEPLYLISQFFPPYTGDDEIRKKDKKI